MTKTLLIAAAICGMAASAFAGQAQASENGCNGFTQRSAPICVVKIDENRPRIVVSTTVLK
jgi:hypothetical protein